MARPFLPISSNSSIFPIQMRDYPASVLPIAHPLFLGYDNLFTNLSVRHCYNSRGSTEPHSLGNYALALECSLPYVLPVCSVTMQ
ncbi:hypothetical protein TNCV_4382641 [Trichonephila clavipes]|nr:hypothetical protein TNCV_4382641 [Trichonephila clavipes]